jgi:hypothetical protein
MLKRYRLGDHGLEPHPEGEFVKIEEAARHFQWHAFNRVLFWIHAREERFFSRGLLHREVIDMRPAPLSELAPGPDIMSEK